MANAKAEKEILKILYKLERNELLRLATTVTQGLFKDKIESSKEAFEVILKYSPDLQSILRRKAVTRDILFSYAHENNVPIILPATKNDLIDMLCQFWDLKPDASSSTSVQQQPFYSNQEQPDSLQTQQYPNDVNALALKFTEWFYTMMNSDKPIGCEHFWADAKLKLHMISLADNINENVDESAEEITRVLFKVKCDHFLYFNPNLMDEGVQGRVDPYGLVVVLACGTLHVNSNCVGVFEQVFMLARDPFSNNNWKIKNTELNLRSREVRAPPRLCDDNLTSNLLSLPRS